MDVNTTRVQQVLERYNYERWATEAAPHNMPVEIKYILDTYKKDIDIYTDNMIYSVNKYLASSLLGRLNHTPLSSKQANSVLHLSKKLYNHGMGSCWSDKPVVINLSTLTIEDGVTRLCAVAEFVSNRGVMLPIKLIKWGLNGARY